MEASAEDPRTAPAGRGCVDSELGLSDRRRKREEKNHLHDFQNLSTQVDIESPDEAALRDFSANLFAEMGPACLDFLVAKPSGLLRDECLRLAAGEWASADPVLALEWISKKTQGPIQTAAAEEAMYVWANADPTAAARWLVAVLPADNKLVAALVKGWSEIDPIAALDWVQMKTSSVNRNELQMQVVISSPPESHQEVATALLLKAGDRWRNNPAVHYLLRSWIARSPAKADEWMRSNQAGAEFSEQVNFGLDAPEPMGE